MIEWMKLHRRSAILIGLTLLVPLYLYLRLLFGLAGEWSESGDSIEKYEPRIARLSGLLAAQDMLSSGADELAAVTEGLVFAGNIPQSTVAARLQTTVRQLFSAAGMSVLDSQVMQVRTEEAFDRMGVKLSATGSLEALDIALGELATHRPMLLVESIEVRPVPESRRNNGPKGQVLNVAVQVAGLRAIR